MDLGNLGGLPKRVKKSYQKRIVKMSSIAFRWRGNYEAIEEKILSMLRISLGQIIRQDPSGGKGSTEGKEKKRRAILQSDNGTDYHHSTPKTYHSGNSTNRNTHEVRNILNTERSGRVFEDVPVVNFMRIFLECSGISSFGLAVANILSCLIREIIPPSQEERKLYAPAIMNKGTNRNPVPCQSETGCAPAMVSLCFQRYI